MTRSVPAPLLSVLDDDVVRVFFAIDLLLDSGSLYLWTGDGDRTISGKPYISAGAVLSISEMGETLDREAVGASISISGIPSQYLAMAYGEPYQSRQCRIYFGTLDDPASYLEMFTGEIDQMPIEDTGSTCTITVKVENSMVMLERPRVCRYSHQYQQSRFPGDKGLIFVAKLQKKEIYFGRKAE